MKYETIYHTIIGRARGRSLSHDVYHEKHHILPRCLGGDNTSSNLVLLTAKEHFVCHHLLTKIYPDHSKLHFAYWAMCNQLNRRDIRVTSSQYAIAKSNFAKVNSRLHSGKTLSKSHIEAMSIAMLGNTHSKKGPLNSNYGKPRPIEIRSKISNTKLLNPEKNYNYKGDYLTPKGIFKTAREASIANGVSVDVIRTRCRDSEQKVSLTHIRMNIDLRDVDLGMTFKQLGFGFFPKV